MKLHHIGYLVKDIQKSSGVFQALGFQKVSLNGQEPVVFDPYRQCNICFMVPAAECDTDTPPTGC